MTRTELMQNWLQQQFPDGGWSIEPASADASFRRYFRVTANGSSHIVMDAPPQNEDCGPFLHVAQIFAAAGVHVPEIIAQNLQQGFLLLSDLGHTTYLAAIDDSNADSLYMDAIDALIRIQLASRPDVLPVYDDALLRRELQLFPEWYAGKHARVELSSSQRDVLERTFSLIVLNNLAQTRVYVHRDYHSRNLMLSAPNPGILDFQDAVYGPITYDLASLFKDAYIRWDEERVLDWCIRYWERARKAGLPVNADFHDFYRDFEWMG
ncbi:MAG: phosphotransferase, partial [Sulfurimicrobium sp.]|nr:phosphotransferase [Sulfurimicrobium sp.]